MAGKTNQDGAAPEQDDIRSTTNDDTNAIHLEDDVLEKMVNHVENIAVVTQDARVSTQFEKNMTIGQAIKMYPKAAFFALTLSMSLVMEGYDTSLLGSFFGYPTFQKKFGKGPLEDGTYQLTASWQSGLQCAVQVSISMHPLCDKFLFKQVFYELITWL